LAIIVLLLAAIVYLLVPRRTTDVVLVDGEQAWNERVAPPRREIVWKPAVPVESPPVAEAKESLIRPQPAENGTVLYFALRKPEADIDIYRSRLVSDRWQPAEPVTELNSEADDVGPVISLDGQRLYLYSNREGGYGGDDLYVAHRTEDGWSEPVNLGPKINSPAREYGAAVSADGTRLFFASNRSPAMHRRIVDNKAPEQGDAWKTTLRADLGQRKFDLYMARRESPDHEWEVASPLSELNWPNTNEGAPCVSLSGAFLYFASDRPERLGEDINYDIYRARIRDDQVSEPENLGRGVNTAASEIEPALSPEGFRLFFSRSQPREPDQPALEELYTLYRSDAAEVEEATVWEAGPWRAITGFFTRNGLWLLLTALVLAILAALVWLLLQIARGRIVVPAVVTCLLIALLFHLLGGAGSFFVYFGEQVVAKIKKELREIVVATHISSADAHQSHEAGKEAYEKVADLKSVEAVKVSDVARQITQLPNVPVAIEDPVAMIPVKLIHEPAPDRPVATIPKSEIDVSDAPRLARHIVARRVDHERIEMEQTRAADQRTERQVARVVVDVDRRQMKPAVADLPKVLPRQTVDPSVRLEREEVAIQRSVEPAEPIADRKPAPIDRTARVVVVEPTAAPKVETEDVVAPVRTPTAAQQPQRIAVDVGRRAPAPQTDAPQMPRRVTVATGTIQPAPEDVPIQRVADGSAEPVTVHPPARVDRTSRVALEPTAAPKVETEDVVVPVRTPTAVQQPQRIAVDLGRRAPAPRTDAPWMRRRVTVDAGAIQPAPEDVPVQRVADEPTEHVTVRQPAQIDRKASSALEPTAAPEVKTEEIGPPAQVARSGVEPLRVPVDMARRKPAPQADVPKMVQPPVADVAVKLARAEESGRVAEIAPSATPESQKVRARLARADAPGKTVATPEAEIIKTEPLPVADRPTPSTRTAGIAVGLDRPEAQLLKVPDHSASQIGGPHHPDNPRLVVGSLENEAVDAPLSLSPIASRIMRRPARAPTLLYAEDNIGLQSLLRLRRTTEQDKQDLVEAFGGSKETLEAIRRGLVWMAQHQHPDGHWSLNRFHQQCKGHKCKGAGREASDTAATGLALLPMLGDGNTHNHGKFKQNVDLGLKWLIEHQKENGDLFTGGGGNAHMYSHAIATIAMCEAYGMSKDPKLHEPAQRSIDFIVSAQHEQGGWRYKPGQKGDMSVFGWQIMALKSGQMANLEIPAKTLEKAEEWLERHRYEAGKYAYQRWSNKNPAMTAEGLLCVQYLGASREDQRLQAGAKFLLSNLPQDKKDNSYYWYYGTQVMWHMQGDYWRQWKDAMEDTLLATQLRNGPMTGSWDVRDNWEQSAGRIYSTSLRILMLEVYFRHLPLYQVSKQ